LLKTRPHHKIVLEHFLRLTFFLAIFLYNKPFFKLVIDWIDVRIDKFLNAVNLTKRRAIAQDMIDEGVVLINGKVVKASKNVGVGDVITLQYLDKEQKFEVLKIPTLKSTPKSEQSLYVKEIA